MKQKLRHAMALIVAGMVINLPSVAHAADFCPALQWITLGTAAGPVPTVQRSEPANLLVAGEQQILVDAGDGTVHQLAKLGLDLGAIQTVFISHHHMDHTGGLGAVLGLRWMNNHPGALTVYGPPGTKELVDGLVASMQPQARIGFGVGELPSPPAERVRAIDIRGGEAVRVGDVTITAVANSHFQHADPQSANPPQSLSYRFDLGGRSVTFTGDTGPSQAVNRLARGSDLLVSEVIDTAKLISSVRTQRPDLPSQAVEDLRLHFTTHHLTAQEVGAMAKAAGVGHIVLTHLGIPSGPLAQSASSLLDDVRTRYDGPVDIARDLESFDIGCERTSSK